jgi:hypothetical protein
MRRFLLSFAVSCAVFGHINASAQEPPLETRLVGAFAGAGKCHWAPTRRESAGAVFLSQIAAQAVSSFAGWVAGNAQAQTQTSTANFILRGDATCVHFVRGALDLRLGPPVQEPPDASVRRLQQVLEGAAVGASDYGELARTLLQNGLPLADAPELIVEARLLRVYRPVEGGNPTPTEFVVLDPTYIYYRDPLFSQPLRFWANDERVFAMQIQVAAAPDAPGAQAAGSTATIGAYERGDISQLIPEEWANVATPRSNFAFRLETNRSYNARVSVSESVSESAFLKFWAEVMGAPPVRQALTTELNYAINQDARDQAQADAYAAARTTLVSSANNCPASSADQSTRVTWIRTNRVILARAYDVYYEAARHAGYSGMPGDFPSAASAEGDEIPRWCEGVRTYLNAH